MCGSFSLTIMDSFGWLSGLIFAFSRRGVNGKLKKLGRKGLSTHKPDSPRRFLVLCLAIKVDTKLVRAKIGEKIFPLPMFSSRCSKLRRSWLRLSAKDVSAPEESRRTREKTSCNQLICVSSHHTLLTLFARIQYPAFKVPVDWVRQPRDTHPRGPKASLSGLSDFHG